MYARVAMYEEVDVGNWDRFAKWFEEHGDAMNQRLAGYMGSMTLVDMRMLCFRGSAATTRKLMQAVDALLDQGALSEMSEDLAEIARACDQAPRGVY